MKFRFTKLALFSTCGVFLLLTPKMYACCTCPAIDVIEQFTCDNGKGCFAQVASSGCNANDKTGCEKCTVQSKLCCGYRPYTQGVGARPCPVPPPCGGGHPCAPTTGKLSVPKAPAEGHIVRSHHQSGFLPEHSLESPSNGGSYATRE